MAKSARASQIKANNQKLKKNVFGPIEAARTARLSAKLLELASQPKPVKEVEMKIIDDDAAAEAKEETTANADTMEVDSGAKAAAKSSGKGRIAKSGIAKRKMKKSSIVFPKYGERNGIQKKRK
ncbi:hypothetical protein B0H66DRAFT_565994 [Apodospora peruviana]|uniref:DUF2423 domain-containing protein n=1 Tax=Apodospora peruviana TaxID=516989 RepID=A0AAE0HWS9_9PEZI|nr:hypothetical protein B0H66DRAFT_565994 [Apodospora peruviana]